MYDERTSLQFRLFVSSPSLAHSLAFYHGYFPCPPSLCANTVDVVETPRAFARASPSLVIRRPSSDRPSSVVGRAPHSSPMSRAWISPLDVDVFSRCAHDDDIERSSEREMSYVTAKRARAFTTSDFASSARDARSSSANDVVVVGVGSATGVECVSAGARASNAHATGSGLFAIDERDGDHWRGGRLRATRARGDGTTRSESSTRASGVTARASSASSCLIYEDEGRRHAFVETSGDVARAGARAWANEVLRATRCRSGTTKVLVVTRCSEHDTSEGEMSHGAIDEVQCYGLETSAAKATRGEWPEAPRALPVGVFLPCDGAAALLAACEMRNISARALAIPESEPVRVLYGGADINSTRAAVRQIGALIGHEFEYEIKILRKPLRAENVYA